MTTSPTPSPDLDAMTARAEAAPPGEWKAHLRWCIVDGRGEIVCWTGSNDALRAAPKEKWPALEARFDALTEFVVNAREDIPALLALVASQRDEIERMKGALLAAMTPQQKAWMGSREICWPHDWRPYGDYDIRDVRCSKCEAPGERQDDGEVYWPAS